ncbi:MAG: hypothetical protein A2Z34_07120 [Planctomycetes bacterium RBG_16_59_8]|nr:MAG: hypothetical protein A2Z34_07120 [Planctomycetes bacterium RBG_16_59_8]
MTDKPELKVALGKFKKRLKLYRLDDESAMGGHGFTAGRSSNIVGIKPPDGFPQEVWDELVAQGKLKAEGGGLYSLVR